MQLVVPTWFKYRQGKAEPAGENTYKLTAPLMQEAYVSIRKGENGRWAGVLRLAADGPEADTTPPQWENPGDAWNAAFELYRAALII
jgi:hypothetical protein